MEQTWQVQKKHINKNPLMKLILRKFNNDVIETISLINPKTVLDIGCGEGFVTIEIAKKINSKIVGIDKEKDAIKYALSNNKLENIEYSTGDIFKLDYFKDKSFDLVMSLEVLEHLENYEKAIEIMCKLSKKYLLLSVPNEPWFRIANVLRLKYLKRFGNTPGHINNWTRKEFRNLCMGYGKIIKFKTSGVWNIVLLEVN